MKWPRLRNRDPAYIRDLVRPLGPGMLALDCGANVGRVTRAMARRGAEVHAFEPNASAFRELTARTHRLRNVHRHHAAVWVADEEIELFMHEKAASDPVTWSVGSSLVKEKGNIDAGVSECVPGIDLARFIGELGREVDLMKIDIEGAECRVLDHLLDTGALHRVRRVVVETHDHKIPELREATEALRQRIAVSGHAGVSLDWI